MAHVIFSHTPVLLLEILSTYFSLMFCLLRLYVSVFSFINVHLNRLCVYDVMFSVVGSATS